MRRVKEAKLALSLRSSLNCARRSTGNTIPFIRMRRLLLGPDVPIAIFGICIGARLLEPWVLVGGVVDYEIDQNTNAALFGAVRKLDEIAERTIARIDIIIVGDVVTIVSTRRSLTRHQPNRSHAQSMQIIEAAHQSLEITSPIAASVHVGPD